MVTSNDIVAGVGIVCAMLSAAIYAAAEAYVDGQHAASNIVTTTTTIGASTTAKDTVEKLLETTSAV